MTAKKTIVPRSGQRLFIVGISFFITVFSGAAAINVACVGDSITYGYGALAHSYPIQLQALFDASEGAGAYHVFNYGKNSLTMRNDGNYPYISTSDYTSSLAANPDVVVILLGSNDAKIGTNWNVPAKDGESTSIEIYKADAEALIESYRNLPSSPQIFICTPVPHSLAGGNSFGISGTVLDTEIAPEIRATLSAPSDVALLDLHTSFPKDDGSHYTSGDRVHPNAAGYGFIAQEVMDAIVGGGEGKAYLDIEIAGNGTVNPPNGAYELGTNIALEATANPGWLFVGWSGDMTGDFTSATTNLLIDTNKFIAATFSDDADGDGILNTNETFLGTDPRNSDTDRDGLSDSEELYTYSTDPLIGDMDEDGLSDGEEILTYNSDPQDVDTDEDGFGDGYEVSTGYDPATTNSTPELSSSIKTSIQFEFNAAIGRTYRIEGAEALSSQWETLEDGIIGPGGIVTRHYKIDVESNKFFRARRN